MSSGEKSNRNHGSTSAGHGGVGSRNVQKGQSKENVKGAKAYREKHMNEGKVDPVKKASQKVDTLRQKLRKAKLDQLELLMVQRETEVVKKEKELKKFQDIIDGDRKQLKDKHSYYTTDTASGTKTKALRE